MISVITSVIDRQGFENLERNLISLEPDWNLGMDLLCIVKEENLFEEVGDFLKKGVNRGKCVVVQDDKGLKAGGDYLEYKNDYVFLLDNRMLLQSGSITSLQKGFLDNPTAGFIGGLNGNQPSVYWVKDIYGVPQYIYSEGDLERGLIEVDTSSVHGILTKTNLFEELFGLSDLDGYGSLSFGIRLRRQGYQNYVDTRVRYREEKNKDENNSA